MISAILPHTDAYIQYMSCVNGPQIVNILWTSDAIWGHRTWWTWWTLVQVMAWCLRAPSHDLNQCWLMMSIISEILWHSFRDSPTAWCLWAFSVYCPNFMCHSLWERQKLDNFMWLLEFEYAKRLKAHNRAVPVHLRAISQEIIEISRYLWYQVENCWFKITAKTLRGQWVK